MGWEVKIALSCQSKHGLVGSSAKKQEKFLLEGHRSTFLGQKHKSAIWNRTPPTYTSNLVYMCAGGFGGHKSSNRIELS